MKKFFIFILTIFAFVLVCSPVKADTGPKRVILYALSANVASLLFSFIIWNIM